MGMPQHELRLGVSPGAAKSYLGYAQKPEPTKYFDLQFAAAASSKERGPKSGDSNITLYEQYGRFKAEPNYGTGVAAVIDIPYPHEEMPLRLVTFKDEPFQDCCTRTDFQIHPRVIPRSNVFIFQISDSGLPVVLQNKKDPQDRHILADGPLRKDVKLYLYSGPPRIGDPMNHLPVFNKMLRYGNYCELDLSPNPDARRSCTPLDQIQLPGGFDLEDIMHLSEINSKGDLCKVHHGINPAECAQGGGC